VIISVVVNEKAALNQHFVYVSKFEKKTKKKTKQNKTKKNNNNNNKKSGISPTTCTYNIKLQHQFQ